MPRPVTDKSESRLSRHRRLLGHLAWVLVGIWTACSEVSLPEPAKGSPPSPVVIIPIVQGCPSQVDETYFLPPRALEGADEHEPPTRDLVNRVLMASGEPSLFCGRDPDEAFRLVEISPVGESPSSIRVSRKYSTYELEAVQLNADPKHYSEVARNHKGLSVAEWESVAREFERLGYWSLPSSLSSGPTPEGTIWLFEARQNGKYHAITRMAYEAKELQSAVQLLKKLGGLKAIPLA